MLQTLRKIAFPISLIYALVVFFRNFLFDIGLLKSQSFDTVTVCVGNLSVGGTGKTPMIEYLVRLLRNHPTAVLSRGYKRKSKGFVLAGPKSTVEHIGDEPYQIHKKFPKVQVAVDADRRNGISQLEKLVQPSVILLDDSFQHRKVNPTYSILLTAYGDLFVDDWYLPTGNLRDSRLEVKRAHMVIVTKCPSFLQEKEQNAIAQKLKLKPNQKLLFSTLGYSSAAKNQDRQEISLSELGPKKVALVTGIAAPGPLLSHLESIGLTTEHFAFTDHHYFKDSEIEKFKDFEIVLTTEKDFGRLVDKVDSLCYIEVAHVFSKEDERILEQTILGLI